MRRKGRVAGILAVAVGTCSSVFAGSLEPPGPPAPTMLTLSQLGAQHNFVGYTTAKRNGAVGTGVGLYGAGGIFGMSAVCQAQYPGSRMCTAGDIFNSPPLPAIGTDCAWVDPDGIPLISPTSAGECTDYDLGSSWQNNNSNIDPGYHDVGTVVAPSTDTRNYGGLAYKACESLCRIACCSID
jgi:hypothetical protein